MIKTNTTGFFHCNSSLTTKNTSLYILKPKTKINRNLFAQALKYSDPKRKELLVANDPIRSEMNLLKGLISNKSKKSSKINWNESMTGFKRFEHLRMENREVFQRKAAINSKKDFSLSHLRDYLLNVKRIVSPIKRLTNNSMDYIRFNNNNNCGYELYETPSKLLNNNKKKFVLKGTKIRLKKYNFIESFLETKALSLNMALMNNSKIQFYDKELKE